MLRGLDINEGAAGDTTIIKVADRASPNADVTVYVDVNATGEPARRQKRVAEEFRRLESAGVVWSASVLSWQDVDAGALYDKFRDAVGEESLAPFFEELAGGNALDVPKVCVAVRDGDELTGVYPRTKDGAEQGVEDCLRALASGDRVRNV